MTSILFVSATALAVLTSICSNYTSTPDACAQQIFDQVLLSDLLVCYDPIDIPSPVLCSLNSSSFSTAPFSGFSSSSSSSLPASFPLGLVHFYPLQGNNSDLVNPAVQTLAVQGNSSCATFEPAWTQSCTAALTVTSFTETGSLTLCIYSFISAFTSSGDQFFWSCNDFSDGTADCLIFRYLPSYSLGVIQFDLNGDGSGVVLNLPTSTWFHTCVMYDTLLSNMSLWIDGELVNSLVVTPLQPLGTPVFAGESLQGSFVNYRIYNRTLSPAEILAVSVSDDPT